MFVMTWKNFTGTAVFDCLLPRVPLEILQSWTRAALSSGVAQGTRVRGLSYSFRFSWVSDKQVPSESGLLCQTAGACLLKTGIFFDTFAKT